MVQVGVEVDMSADRVNGLTAVRLQVKGILDTEGTSLMHTLNLFNLNVYLINKAKNESTCITVIIKSKKVVFYTSKSLFDRKIK